PSSSALSMKISRSCCHLSSVKSATESPIVISPSDDASLLSLEASCPHAAAMLNNRTDRIAKAPDFKTFLIKMTPFMFRIECVLVLFVHLTNKQSCRNIYSTSYSVTKIPAAFPTSKTPHFYQARYRHSLK